MSNLEVKPGDTVELKDKESGFYDDETNFKVVRDQQVKLGESIGRRTNAALMSGGLLIVSGKSKKDEANQDESDLPDDIPGRKEFVAAGMNYEQVKTFDFEKDKVAGIGAKTVEAVQSYLKK